MPPHSRAIRPQAPSEDAVWEDGQWLPLLDARDSETPRCPLINLDHPAPEVPASDKKRTALLRTLLFGAQQHLKITGRHLQVYPEIGELFVALTYGLKITRSTPVGSEGRLGDDHYLIKVITPENASTTVSMKMSANFSHLAVVRITSDFEISARVMAREDLPGTSDQLRQIRWSAMPKGPANATDR